MPKKCLKRDSCNDDSRMVDSRLVDSFNDRLYLKMPKKRQLQKKKQLKRLCRNHDRLNKNLPENLLAALISSTIVLTMEVLTQSWYTLAGRLFQSYCEQNI